MSNTLRKPALNEYERQAADFLEATGTKLTVTFLYTGPYFSTDEESRDVYSFTLQNSKGVYPAKFGDSIQNTRIRALALSGGSRSFKEDHDLARRCGIENKRTGHIDYKMVAKLKNKKPEAYDILACLSSYYPETFADFCDEFGYSNDCDLSEYPKIMGIFEACKTEERGLKSMYSEQELEQLSEIQ